MNIYQGRKYDWLPDEKWRQKIAFPVPRVESKSTHGDKKKCLFVIQD
jgi:hypothetical protein